MLTNESEKKNKTKNKRQQKKQISLFGLWMVSCHISKNNIKCYIYYLCGCANKSIPIDGRSIRGNVLDKVEIERVYNSIYSIINN